MTTSSSNSRRSRNALCSVSLGILSLSARDAHGFSRASISTRTDNYQKDNTSRIQQKKQNNNPQRFVRSRRQSRIFNDPNLESEETQAPGETFKVDDTLINSMFDDEASAKAQTAAFGDSVPLSAKKASFGDSVPMRRKPTSSSHHDGSDGGDLFTTNGGSTMDVVASSTGAVAVEGQDQLQAMRKRNLVVAILSIAFAVSSYLWQFTHPITPLQLLSTMQTNSAPLTAIGTNGRPTVVDFWAPWCENCKAAAPTLLSLEEEYKDQINFVMVNGDRPEAWPLIERFGVDAIPHLALINAEGDVETALIGPIPKRVLKADLNVLIQNANNKDNNKNGEQWQATKEELPYKMLDAFARHPELRRIKFTVDEP